MGDGFHEQVLAYRNISGDSKNGAKAFTSASRNVCCRVIRLRADSLHPTLDPPTGGYVMGGDALSVREFGTTFKSFLESVRRLQR